MSAAWIVFIVVSMIFFRDPIIELKQREAKQSKDESDDRCGTACLTRKIFWVDPHQCSER